MAKYNAFLDIVTQRDDPKINRNKPKCPLCGSKKVDCQITYTTLVGGYNNHIHHDCTCKECNESFQMEIAEKGKRNDYIGWFTQDRKVIGGIPGCFEGYIYTCSQCGGNVKRHQLELDSDKPVSCLASGPDENGVWFKQYRNVWRCDSCEAEVESENDYFKRNPPEPKTYEEKVEEAKERRERENKIMSGWTITEEVGTCIINDYAIAKLDTELTNETAKELDTDEQK